MSISCKRSPQHSGATKRYVRSPYCAVCSSRSAAPHARSVESSRCISATWAAARARTRRRGAARPWCGGG
eukprot:5993865-Prymnesium_polylepis.2